MEKYLTGININTYESLMNSCTPCSFSINDNSRYIAFHTIDRFTMLQNEDVEKAKQDTLGQVYDINYIKYNESENCFHYVKDDFEINFRKFSDVIRAYYYKEQLHNDERSSLAPIKSCEIAPYLSKSNILTGFILIGNLKMMHTVIELVDEGLIIDWSINAIMKKEDYLRLTKLQVINKLETDKLIEDRMSGFLTVFLDSVIPLKFYLLFRDELVKDLDKNKQLINMK